MTIKKYLPIIFLTFFFFAIFTYHTIYRHRTFNSHAFDLGIYSQVTYLYSQGVTPLSSLKHMNILGDHFGPVLFLISPFYKLFPTPETLLIIQALFVSTSGIFIYLIAKDKLKDETLSLIITFAYLSAPGILSAVNFDFHLATISVLPLSALLYTWYFKKWKLYILTLFLGLLFKEDFPIFILGLGLFSILKKQKILGTVTISIGLLSYYIIKYQIMGRISPGAEDAYVGTVNLPSLFSGLFSKGYTLTTLYGQLIFLPLLSPLSWLTVFPYLLLRFSSTEPHYWGTHFHYNANLAPFLVASAIFALSKFRFSKKIIITLFTLVLVLSNTRLNVFIPNTLHFNFNDTKQFEYLKKTLEKIPKDKAVSAQSPIVSHLSNRDKIYLYPEVLDAEYIILDESLNFYPMQNLEFKDKISALKENSEWEVKEKVETLYIFKRSSSAR